MSDFSVFHPAGERKDMLEATRIALSYLDDSIILM